MRGEFKMKIEKVESKDSTFWKYYIKGSPLKKQYHSLFCGACKLSRINDFYTENLGK